MRQAYFCKPRPFCGSHLFHRSLLEDTAMLLKSKRDTSFDRNKVLQIRFAAGKRDAEEDLPGSDCRPEIPGEHDGSPKQKTQHAFD